MTKITKRIVDSSHPKPDRYFVWDDSIPGFGLVIQPSGVKSYCFQYRNKEGRSNRTTIGKHSEKLTADQARKEALKLQAQIIHGKDPLADKRERLGALTVANVLDRYALSGKFAEKSAETQSYDLSRIKWHLKPTLGRVIADKITTDHLRKAAEAIEKGKTATTVKTKARGVARVRGGPGAARMAMRLLKSAYSWASNPHEGKLLSENYTAGFKVGQDGTRDIVLSHDEYLSLFKTINEMEEKREIRQTAADALRIIAFTGARRGEIAGLRWRHIEFKLGIIKLPPAEHKTGKKTGKPRTIGLPAAAQEILTRQPEGAPDDFVFPPTSGDRPIRLGKPWRQIRAKSGINPAIGTHGFRHSLATQMAESGAGAAQIMGVMGHKNLSTSQKYIHMAEARQAENAERAAAGISAAFAGKSEKDAAKVTPIKRGAKKSRP